jgi:hypothetical protein
VNTQHKAENQKTKLLAEKAEADSARYGSPWMTRAVTITT